MKLCTTFEKKNDQGDLNVLGWSLVEDNHQFGWVDGVLHVEGSIRVVDEIPKEIPSED